MEGYFRTGSGSFLTEIRYIPEVPTYLLTYYYIVIIIIFEHFLLT